MNNWHKHKKDLFVQNPGPESALSSGLFILDMVLRRCKYLKNTKLKSSIENYTESYAGTFHFGGKSSNEGKLVRFLLKNKAPSYVKFRLSCHFYYSFVA